MLSQVQSCAGRVWVNRAQEWLVDKRMVGSQKLIIINVGSYVMLHNGLASQQGLMFLAFNGPCHVLWWLIVVSAKGLATKNKMGIVEIQHATMIAWYGATCANLSDDQKWLVACSCCLRTGWCVSKGQ